MWELLRGWICSYMLQCILVLVIKSSDIMLHTSSSEHKCANFKCILSASAGSKISSPWVSPFISFCHIRPCSLFTNVTSNLHEFHSHCKPYNMHKVREVMSVYLLRVPCKFQLWYIHHLNYAKSYTSSNFLKQKKKKKKKI